MRNDTEVRVVALRRSGQHPIINWIIKNATGTRCFINNVEANTDPFIFNMGVETYNINSKQIKKTYKDFLIYNYEDKTLEDVFSNLLNESHDYIFGKSRRIIDLLILRDPYNCFASRLKKMQTRGSGFPGVICALHRKHVDYYVKIWKTYAREFLNISGIMKSNKVVVNYNKWFQDSNYRDELAKVIGLKSSDKGLKEVPPHGRGSSFDQQTYQGQANLMNILQRWRSFEYDSFFQGIFQDHELIQLSEKIFGHIPGTEKLINRTGTFDTIMKIPIRTRIRIVLGRLSKQKLLAPVIRHVVVLIDLFRKYS